jgi:hypothetical protein
MIEKSVILSESTPIEVKLSSDEKGIVSLGIRIDGTAWCVLAPNITTPEAERSETWSKNVGDLV